MGTAQSSARSNAADFANDEWKPRRALAVLLRVVIIVCPLLAGLAASRAVAGSLRRPADLAGKALWMLIVTGFAFVAFQLARRLLERLTPLTFLLNLNLVFPDQAPSRFKTALRSESARDIERKLQQANEDDAVSLPMAAEHAQSLVGLVSQLSDHDRRTRGHSERVRAYSDIIAEQLDLSKQDRERLHWSALLHDVGKLFVDPGLLNAPGRPDEHGWKQIQGHPAKAEDLLVGLKPWLGEWTRAASEHHERFDGTGYPAGLGGTDI